MASAWSATLRERKVTGVSCPYQVSNTKLRSSKAKACSAGLAASSSTKTNDFLNFLEVSKLLLQGDSTNDIEPCGDSHAAGCCWMLLDTRPDRYMQLSGLIVLSVGGWKQLPQPQPQSDPLQTIPSQQSLRPSWCSTKRCNVHNAVLTVLYHTIRIVSHSFGNSSLLALVRCTETMWLREVWKWMEMSQMVLWHCCCRCPSQQQWQDQLLNRCVQQHIGFALNPWDPRLLETCAKTRHGKMVRTKRRLLDLSSATPFRRIRTRKADHKSPVEFITCEWSDSKIKCEFANEVLRSKLRNLVDALPALWSAGVTNCSSCQQNRI